MFSFLPVEDSCVLGTVDSADNKTILESLHLGNFKKLSDGSIKLKSHNPGKNKELCDIPWLHPEGLLCTEKAYNLLKPILEKCGEWNLLTYNLKPMFYFSTTRVVDALDDDKTEFIEHDGFKLGAKKYVFKDGKFNNFPIFRMQSLKGHYPIVTEIFVNFVNENKLSGLKFKELI
jgi:hypothetical protein